MFDWHHFSLEVKWGKTDLGQRESGPGCSPSEVERRTTGAQLNEWKTFLLQCCLLRRTTLATLLRFHQGPQRLSQLMRQSLSRDPLDPVLWEPHLKALDRRVAVILRVVRHCLTQLPADQVLVGLTPWLRTNDA